jgi:predicted lysophospholipase L1 biosynthesis ABC-type transport system permease subunit
LIMLTIVGAAIGILLGYLAQQGLAWIARDLIAQDLPAPGASPRADARLAIGGG